MRPMGAWGVGPFDNDDACDWLDDVVEGGGDLLREVFALAVGRDHVEAPDGMIVVAAAEVVACMRGRGRGGELPEALAALLTRAAPPDPELVEAARAGVDRVLGARSELHDLWRDSDSYGAWRSDLADLRRRLG